MSTCQKKGQHQFKTLRFFPGVDGNWWREVKCDRCPYRDLYKDKAPDLEKVPQILQ